MAPRTNGKAFEEAYVDPFEQEDASEFVGSAVKEAKAYVRAQRDYYALVAAERGGRITGAIMGKVVVAVLLACVILFCSVAGGFYFGRLLGDTALGFLIIGGAYLLILGIFSLWWNASGRESMTLNVINSLNDGDE